MYNSLTSRAIGTHRIEELDSGWQIASSDPNSVTGELIESTVLQWQDGMVPGTVAQAIRRDINLPGHYDRHDWWYRTTFDAPNVSTDKIIRHHLRFEGLATLADIWLNGKKILSSENMFCSHVVDVTEQLLASNILVIHFKSLQSELERKQPRPRWKTALTHHQNLRWLRTTLLGRMPAWSPPIEAVGPWRPVTLESIVDIDCVELDLQTGVIGNVGEVRVRATLQLHREKPSRADLVVDGCRHTLQLENDGPMLTVVGTIQIADAPKWWPHTHGSQPLLPCRIELVFDDESINIDCGRIGFKSVQVNRDNGLLQFTVNKMPVFCRGACWTVNDIISLSGNKASLRRALELARAANLNMLRIGGTMVYECNEFYSLCDELGIMVWQDFMFANMDYPFDDAAFFENVKTEIGQQLNRLQKHVSIAAYCAGSEIQQQAAMMGLPREEWTHNFFSKELPQLCAAAHCEIPYFEGSPSEGTLPFETSVGVAHYYGVGAYRRPFTDIRQANIKFAAECLGFSNVPEFSTIALLLDGKLPAPHHPRWKARVPRDSGSGYDFEDIRDFYLHHLFKIDPIALRSEDVERYYALSRVVSGEVMKYAFAEWRSTNSQCSGALIWFYKDLWPGAGWGIIDSENNPKAAYYYLRRAWAPVALLVTDEGLNGLNLHAINETDKPVNVKIELHLIQSGTVSIVRAERTVELPVRSVTALNANEMIGYFTDINYAYRFGPPKHEVVAARMVESSTAHLISEDFYFPQSMSLPSHPSNELKATAVFDSDGNVLLTIHSSCFLQSVQIVADGFTAEDNYFHCTPDHLKSVTLMPTRPVKKFKAIISALNLRDSITVRAERTE